MAIAAINLCDATETDLEETDLKVSDLNIR